MKNKISKSTKNYYVDIAALLPVLLLSATGVILLKYHSGAADTENALGMNGFFWRHAHAIVGVISIALIGLHLALHLSWFKNLLSKKKKSKYWKRNLTLLFFFTAASITGIIPWLFLDGTKGARLMLGIHNKFGLIVIIFVVVHILSYLKWLISMTKKTF